MGNSVYRINKGIGRPMVFKGLKAQYIWWLGGGMVVLLVLFAILYLIGVNAYICAGLILVAGAGVVAYVYRLSNTYGAQGMMKAVASKKVPHVLKCNSRKLFIKTSGDGKVAE